MHAFAFNIVSLLEFVFGIGCLVAQFIATVKGRVFPFILLETDNFVFTIVGVRAYDIGCGAALVTPHVV